MVKVSYTVDTREVLRQCRLRAINWSVDLDERRAPFILLWTFVRWEACLASTLIQSIISDENAFADQVKDAVANVLSPKRQPSVSTSGKPVFDLAEEGITTLLKEANDIARENGVTYVGTEHLLIALVKYHNAASRLLKTNGITEDVIDEVLADLRRKVEKRTE